MSKLRFPLAQHLLDPVDETALHRIEQEVDARFPQHTPRRLLPLVLASVAVLAAIVTASLTARRDRGPLRLASGDPILSVEAAGQEANLVLSDGSRIQLLPGARLEPLEASSATFSAMLVHGSANFNVRPGGPRRWVVECGLATVEVIGTEFTCQRGQGRLRVSVKRGIVLMRGERVPDRVRRLTAGEWLDVLDVIPRPAASAVEPPAVTPAPAQGGSSPIRYSPSASDRPGTQRPLGRRADAVSWRDLAGRGQHQEAFTALGGEGLRREAKRVGVRDLLALADVARLSGHPADAVAPLERILAEFAEDPQAPLAAFALGRLEMDSLGRPARAVSALHQALALGIPRSLREDVKARLVEAYVRQGDRPAARSAADAYFQEFPDGRHRHAIGRWLADR
jgi:transmembrane sensor